MVSHLAERTEQRIMSDYQDMFLHVISMAQTAVTPSIVVGSLPPLDGISMAVSTGATNDTMLDKGLTQQISVVINSKSSDQQNALEWLALIHEALTMTESYPSGTNWQITNIESSELPTYIDREQNNQYLYGSAVRVYYYIKKGT